MSDTETTYDVGEDNALGTDEKQVSFTTTKGEAPAVRFHSEVASVTRKLLHHPHATIENTREQNGSVVAVTGTIPLGCLTVKANPKSNHRFNRLVSSGVLTDNE